MTAAARELHTANPALRAARNALARSISKALEAPDPATRRRAVASAFRDFDRDSAGAMAAMRDALGLFRDLLDRWRGALEASVLDALPDSGAFMASARKADGSRVLIDTEAINDVVEEAEDDIAGAFYDFDWEVGRAFKDLEEAIR